MSAAKDIEFLSRWHLAQNGKGPDYRDVTVTIPIRTVSELNAREHHMARYRRRSKQRNDVKLVMTATLKAEGIGAPCLVTMTRLAPSKGLDSDNLVSSMKGVRDAVADALGIDDADERVTWRYEQRRSPRGKWGVEICVSKAPREVS